MESLRNKVLQKKELSGISLKFVNKIIEETIAENNKLYQVLEAKNFNERSKEFESLLKIIRKKLRVYHGSFTKNYINNEEKINFLEKIKQGKNEEIELLKKHQSTFERVNFYKEVYKLIKDDKKILDLGCGYNPFSYYLIKNKDFICSDINKEESDFINKYFELKNVNGKSLVHDLTNKEDLEEISELSKGKTCLLFKVLDTLESIERNYSKKLIDTLKSDKIIISFPTKSLGGKKDMKTKRTWFENMIKEYKTEKIEIGNEIYYIVYKKY